jgi:hypothetical protein
MCHLLSYTIGKHENRPVVTDSNFCLALPFTLLLLFLSIIHFRQTAKMVAESAVCLALDRPRLPATAGVLTPASAMGPVLRQRLGNKGMHFVITQK